MGRLDGKAALVTGAAAGLGRATALALAAEGVTVVAADLEADRAMVAFAAGACGGLDLVHLNAGVATGCGVGDDFDLARYRRAMGANLDGVVFGVHAALPVLREGGAIVATASLAGLTGVPYDPLYAANKHAVVGLVRSLAPGLAEAGIRINAVCPGFAETAIIAGIRDALLATGLDLIAPEAVAAAVVELFAGDASGECVVIQPGREPLPFAFRGVPGPR